MGSLLSTVFKTAILDDAAFQEWRERPNLFLRGIVLIILVSLVAGLIVFVINFVNMATPVDAAKIEEEIYRNLEMQSQFNPSFQDPEVRKLIDGMMDVMIPMVTEIAKIEAPLPRGITGFFQAVGGWLSRALVAIGGWMFYGALVLIFVNLLGGSAKLPDFLGTVALYIVPALLGLLSPVPCVGWLIALIGMIWSVVVYIKAVSVAGDLDGGRAIVAAVAPLAAIVLLGFLLLILWIIWFAIVF
jgi:hypothetical protein